MSSTRSAFNMLTESALGRRDSPRRGLVVGFGDQVLSSGGNALMLIALGRTATATEFGISAILITVLTAGLALTRGGVGTPILLMGGRRREDIEWEARGALAAALLLGVVVGMCVVLAGIILDVWSLCIPLAVAAPIVLQQDALRHVSLIRDGGSAAIISDGVWMAVSVVAVLASVAFVITPQFVLWAWAIGAVVAMAALYIRLSLRPGVSALAPWWRSRRGDRVKFSGEAFVGSMSSLLVIGTLAAILGASGVAALRGAGVIMGPLSVLFGAAPLAVIPHARRSRATSNEIWRAIRPLAVAMSLAALSLGIGMSMLPESAGRMLLGDSWSGTALVLPVTAIEYACLAWLFSFWAFFKATGQPNVLLAARSGHLVVSGVLAITGAAVLGSAAGAAAGLAAGALLSIICVAILVMPRAEAGSRKLGR